MLPLKRGSRPTNAASYGCSKICSTTVEDDGAGVPNPLRERIFERFVRVDDDGGGTGLGLPICRAIVRAHGGDVTLESGSRFVARFRRDA